jgi:quercetin dioxygenase-like cupin family protein
VPRPGQRIVNPITGERIVFRRTTDETGGECVLFDVELRPGGVIAGAPHHHPHEERFHVTKGRLAGWIAGEGRISKVAGDRFVVPSGVDHFLFNGALGTTGAQVEARPGGAFDRLLEVAFEVSHGRLGRTDEMARLMLDQHVMASFVPDALQERLLAALSSVGSAVPAA